MNEGLKFNRKIRNIGGSLGITLPKEVFDYLEVKENEDVIAVPSIGKKGKFVFIYKKQENENNITEENGI